MVDTFMNALMLLRVWLKKNELDATPGTKLILEFPTKDEAWRAEAAFKLGINNPAVMDEPLAYNKFKVMGFEIEFKGRKG